MLMGTDADARLELIKKYGTNPYSSLLTYQDISIFPLSTVDGFVGYQNKRNMLLVMGEPICPPEHYRAAIQEFIGFCLKERKSFLQICCGEAYCAAVKGLEFSCVMIGENYIFDPSTYSPRGRRGKIVRWASKKAVQSGVVVREYDPRGHPDLALEACLEGMALRWMKKKNQLTPHLHDLNLFENCYLKRYFYAEMEGTPVALIICLPIYGAQGCLFEDVIRDPACPYGTIELMTLKILERLKDDSFGKMATFGLSPRLDVSGLNGTSLFFAKIGMLLANRLFRLRQLHHFRKKFNTNHVEPSYALKYPKGFKLIDLVRIGTIF